MQDNNGGANSAVNIGVLHSLAGIVASLLLMAPLCHGEETQERASQPRTISALDTNRVVQTGNWRPGKFRFAATSHLHTTANGAALEYEFDGTGVALRLGGHDTPAYGPPNLGSIAVSIDGSVPRILRPRALPREVVLGNGLALGPHRVRIEHRGDGGLVGCRIESFQSWGDARGALKVNVGGEENSFLNDCRAILRQGNTIIRNSLVRNWLTGQCALAGLPIGDGYTLELQATGWRTHRTAEFAIEAGTPTELAPIYLRRDGSTVIERFRFPRVNQPVIRKPGEKFRARFLGFGATINEVRLTRQIGPATISRVVAFEEDKASAYYYDREVVVALPEDMPSGAYDLTVTVSGEGRDGVCRSPRSVHVVARYSTDPTFVSFGHLDTSGQYQAEYLKRLVAIINLLAPDVVLCSTAANPAYISGALAGLDVPYVINFGNHQVPGHEAWFGDPVGMVDVGPHLSILNFGHPWHVGTTKAEALLASRPDTAIKVINAFEPNAPIDFLNRHRVRMIHDAHGPGERVMDLGATPTRRVGKTNSESFRVIRFRDNQVESCTYNGHKTAPVPFGREAESPLSVTFARPSDGTHAENVATVTNRLFEAYPNGRVTFVMPAGEYQVTGGRLESSVVSDDGQFVVLSVRVDIPAAASVEIGVGRKQ
jgi:hypothetical protein